MIRYVLDTDDYTVTSDRFVFDVSDTAPNVVSGTVFRIRWALIHFEKAVYNVSEQQGSIGVTVKRTGNLNQVGCYENDIQMTPQMLHYPNILLFDLNVTCTLRCS